MIEKITGVKEAYEIVKNKDRGMSDAEKLWRESEKAYRRMKGSCVSCGKRKAVKGGSTCRRCRARKREYYFRYKEELKCRSRQTD